ncbi:hypothetical protein OIE63_06570 [Streptomyces sp. NBC_01795]|uniref:hypothetical protein n=1 Tax=Streptomyces sp. NBC_01795 TaxID=2975943 RepID=UPI002DDC681A|nr:hypothetical protein [Streptomyces sp. NBC_01795]WSA91252.1 hypothetical protein OIE63_06570 [Streptomyces sp. NBC_01795]
MEAVIASAVAVLGTLLGAGLTQAFQQRTVARTEEFARRERLRQERLEVFGRYASALLNYRRALVHRWFCEHEDPPPADPGEARTRSYDLRSEAQEALFRVRMLSDGALGARATGVLDAIEELPRTEERAELDRRRRETKELISAFVTEATTRLGG